jgi:hypothetical protein
LKACPFENLGLDSGFRRRDEFEASSLFVIPAPYQVRGKLQPESSVSGENRDPVFEMVPDFRRDDIWMPDQVRHDGEKSLWTDSI